MTNPKVSVIIRTIGRTSLKRTLESVINQTYKNLEIIVTDDTEDRRAYQIVKPYMERDSRIKYTVNTKYKRGPAGNKNNGLDHITCEFFTFVDDDDTLMPEAIEKLLNTAMERNYHIVFGNYIDQNGNFTGKHRGKSEEVSYRDYLCDKYEGEYFYLYKTSLLENERFIDDCWGGEKILWLKIWKRAKKAYYLHETLKVYRYIGEDSVTQATISPNPEIAYRQMLNYFYYLQIHFDDFKEWCPKQVFRFALRGMQFANLSGRKSMIGWFLSKCYKASKKDTILAIPWAMVCLFMPRKLMLKIWNSQYLRKLKEWIKSAILGGKNV